ncbi:MAG: hypothetical protein Q8P67_12595 [archaeon]|nr:hypothetical protein [archaeon]
MASSGSGSSERGASLAERPSSATRTSAGSSTCGAHHLAELGRDRLELLGETSIIF